MNPFAFREQWQVWYPDSIPIGYLLRERYPDRWLRIYSLPGGRRYPETTQDWDELLARHNAAADVVLGRGASCMLIVAYLGDQAEDVAFASEFGLEPYAAGREYELSRRADLEEDPIELWSAPTSWEPRRFETEIRRCADDRGPRFLLVAMDTGHVYAPYDGGADLMAPDSIQRLRFRAALRAWVSPRSDGL